MKICSLLEIALVNLKFFSNGICKDIEAKDDLDLPGTI